MTDQTYGDLEINARNAWSMYDPPIIEEAKNIDTFLYFLKSPSSQRVELHLERNDLTLSVIGPHGSVVYRHEKGSYGNVAHRRDIIDAVEDYPKRVNVTDRRRLARTLRAAFDGHSDS